MAIKKIDLNKYKITIELGYDVLGKRKRKTEVFNGSKQEATKREAELKNEFYHIGKAINIINLTFEEYSEIFIKKYCEPTIAPITLSGYKRLLERINPIIGKYQLRKITSIILDDMYYQLRIGVDGKVLGYHSQYAYYKLIRVMFNKAINCGWIDKNPNDNVNNKPKREYKEKKFYDINQVNKLLNVLENESIKYKTLILLALDSGARRSEICALRWSDIDFNTRILSITKSLKIVDGVVDEKTTKTESSKRKIMLSESTINVLKQYQEWQNAFIKDNSKMWKGTDRIFTSKDGNYIYPSTCDHILKKIVKKYELDPICFHELRHTCASLLINAGIDPKTVSKRLGHSDTSITMEIYSHVFESSKIACANKFDEMFKNTLFD